MSIIFLFLLYIAADANVIPWQFPNSSISLIVSTGIDIALVLLYGSAIALPFVALAVLTIELLARRPFVKLLFNVANAVLYTGAASVVFAYLGTVGESPLASGTQVMAWLLAAAAHVLVNASLLALMISSASNAPFMHLLRMMLSGGAGMQQWTLPPLGALIAVLQLHSPWALTLAILPLVAIYVSFRRYVELNQQTRTVMEMLADTVDVRDPITSQHSLRVTEYTRVIIEALGSVPLSEAETLLAAARIHDLGKVGISDACLHKQGPLTPEERADMERHPVLGAQLLKPLSMYQDGLAIVRHHHERWDGRGYPDRLSGEQIPFGARVLAVADSFDAMTSDRPYRRALTTERALAEIAGGRATQFDPTIVDAFLLTMRQRAEAARIRPSTTLEPAE
jgi:HD-GYP domain-containing protein (c-di-GMP phosphodiesterase class II)